VCVRVCACVCVCVCMCVCSLYLVLCIYEPEPQSIKADSLQALKVLQESDPLHFLALLN
jgi:hypothetical protein